MDDVRISGTSSALASRASRQWMASTCSRLSWCPVRSIPGRWPSRCMRIPRPEAIRFGNECNGLRSWTRSRERGGIGPRCLPRGRRATTPYASCRTIPKSACLSKWSAFSGSTEGCRRLDLGHGAVPGSTLTGLIVVQVPGVLVSWLSRRHRCADAVAQEPLDVTGLEFGVDHLEAAGSTGVTVACWPSVSAWSAATGWVRRLRRPSTSVSLWRRPASESAPRCSSSTVWWKTASAR